MDFGCVFLIQTIVSVVFLLVFMSVPGALLLSFLFERRVSPVDRLFAPLAGCCVVGPVSLLAAYLFGYTRAVVISSWLVAAAILFLLSRGKKQEDAADVPVIRSGWVVLIVLASVAWALLPAFPIYPVIRDGGLYVNTQIFDHIKMAFSESIVRNGLPPINPFYAPDGEAVPLNYFYLWQFIVAHIRLLTGVSAWSAEVAMTWFTAFAGIAALAGLAVKISGRAAAGLLVPLLAVAGESLHVPARWLGSWVQRWLYNPGFHGLESLWVQLSWAAQHVFSGFALVLLLYFLALLLSGRMTAWRAAVGLALCAASALCTSVWIGGVALAATLPVLAVALVFMRLPGRTWRKLTGVGMLAVPLALLMAWPVLRVISGEGGNGEGLPLAIRYFFAELIAHCSPGRKLLHYTAFWVWYLPMVFGAAYLMGVYSLFVLKTRGEWIRRFRMLSWVFVTVYLLVVEFVRSTIMNNDLGWRTVMLPVMLLMIWAAAGLADLLHRLLPSGRKAPGGGSGKGPGLILTVSAVLWISGVVWTVLLVKYHKQCVSVSAEEHAMRQDFLAHKAAWDNLRELTSPDDLVQCNPDAFSAMTTWPCNLGWVLFSNRRIGFSTPEHTFVYAHGTPAEERAAYYAVLTNVFSATPNPDAVRRLREQYGIDALLITRRDRVFASTAIEDSGLYRATDVNQDYKLLLAE